MIDLARIVHELDYARAPGDPPPPTGSDALERGLAAGLRETTLCIAQSQLAPRSASPAAPALAP